MITINLVKAKDRMDILKGMIKSFVCCRRNEFNSIKLFEREDENTLDVYIEIIASDENVEKFIKVLKLEYFEVFEDEEMEAL